MKTSGITGIMPWSLLFAAYTITHVCSCGALPKDKESQEPAAANPLLEKEAAEKYGKDLEGVEPYETDLFKELLPGHDIYKIDVFNPKSEIAGPPNLCFTAVISKKGQVQFLESREQCASFISKHIKKVESKTQALRLAELFAALARIEIVTSKKEIKKRSETMLFKLPPEPVTPMTAQFIQDKGITKFIVFFYAVTDPWITAVLKFRLEFSREGTIVVHEEWFCSATAYE
jgi:hypothetical protein